MVRNAGFGNELLQHSRTSIEGGPVLTGTESRPLRQITPGNYGGPEVPSHLNHLNG